MSAKQANTVMLYAQTIWQQGYNIYLLLYQAFLDSLVQLKMNTGSRLL